MEIPQYDAIFMIGPQGSGKGTQGKLLAEKLGFYYWEMGAILREEAKKDNDFGRQVKALIDNGRMLEDDQLIPFLDKALPEVMKHKRILFDGVPRRKRQAEYLIHYLERNGFKEFATIFINVPREESVKRLLLRAHHEFRQDDTPEKIEERLHLYELETLPVLDYLKTFGHFYNIDGVGSVEEITTRVNQAVGA